MIPKLVTKKINIMKSIYKFATIILISVNCKAQQPIIPLYHGIDYMHTDNAYYKDIDGDLTKLVGSWSYTNGNEMIKVVLKKKSFHFVNFPVSNVSVYKDILYGEYQYIDENGQQLVNTLSDIDSFTDFSQHLIYGSRIKGKYDFPLCQDCSEDERRVKVFIEDPMRPYYDYDMEIRYIPNELIGAPDQIKIRIKRTDMANVPQGQPEDDRILIDELVLTKQL